MEVLTGPHPLWNCKGKISSCLSKLWFLSYMLQTSLTHTALLPIHAKVQEDWILSMSWNSYREMCHLDLKQNFYFPDSCNNKIMVKWLVWALSQHIIANPGRQNASFPGCSADCSWKKLRPMKRWITPFPPAIVSPAARPLLCWEGF